MLKTCFLPIHYPNLTNKTCGEIICQTESTFTIICKLCDIKIFQYDEFIEHFRTIHWSDISRPEILSKQEKPEETSELYEEFELNKIIKTEEYITEIDDHDNEEHNSTDEDKINVEWLKHNDDKGEDSCSNELDEDSEDSTKPLKILKKVHRHV